LFNRYFWPREDNNDGNIEEEEGVGEEEPEEEQGEEEDSSISEEEEETGDDEPDPWSPLRQKAGEDIEESYLKEVQQFLDKGNPKTMPKMLLLMPYYLQVEEGYGRLT